MWAQYYTREGNGPNWCWQGVDDVDERRGGPLGDQLDDIHRADTDTENHNNDPSDTFLEAK